MSIGFKPFKTSPFSAATFVSVQLVQDCRSKFDWCCFSQLWCLSSAACYKDLQAPRRLTLDCLSHWDRCPRRQSQQPSSWWSQPVAMIYMIWMKIILNQCLNQHNQYLISILQVYFVCIYIYIHQFISICYAISISIHWSIYSEWRSMHPDKAPRWQRSAPLQPFLACHLSMGLQTGLLGYAWGISRLVNLGTCQVTALCWLCLW